MTLFRFIWLTLFLAATLCQPPDATAVDLESRYAVISYEDHNALKRFNKELYMGRLSSQMPGSADGTIEGEVVAKIDFIVEKVMVTLDMILPRLRFTIMIHENESLVQKEFRDIYGVDVDYIAFYSPSLNKVFFSAGTSALRVVAHEIGHVVAENYFPISPPQRIHEVMAQYAEQHITD